jgi:hypothetical protein
VCALKLAQALEIKVNLLKQTKQKIIIASLRAFETKSSSREIKNYAKQYTIGEEHLHSMKSSVEHTHMHPHARTRKIKVDLVKQVTPCKRTANKQTQLLEVDAPLSEKQTSSLFKTFQKPKSFAVLLYA